ncbi:1,4-alpha-glucan branching protein GlgB [soil metagenome]
MPDKFVPRGSAHDLGAPDPAGLDLAGAELAGVDPADLEILVAGRHDHPHAVLGIHPWRTGSVVRAHRPDAEAITVVAGAERHPMSRVGESDVFSAVLEHPPTTGYRLEVSYPDGNTFDVGDPYRFWPTLGEIDLHLVGDGRHQHPWQGLGAHVREHQGSTGTSFAVWAPSARAVRVVGDFNGWDGRIHPMRSLGSSGVWELFVPDAGPGTVYKYELVTPDGALRLKADPLAFAAQHPPETSSVVVQSEHSWADAAWIADRAGNDPLTRPLSVYEVHLGSWRVHPDTGAPLGYREMADQLADYVTDLGFTHVELLPVAEHPFGGSWGYQVSSYYAPTSRFGSPDDFRAFVDILHQRGVGVIVDWVPAHFPKDDWALARFDGTALYEHDDPRLGEHPEWGTLVFNFGRNEVRNFLVANALYWLEEFHIDGLRVDAVASMLYLDYSREEGQWLPNRHGGNENLEAVEFLQEMNTVVHARHPGALTIAEESTAWPGVSRPVFLGGLGFGHKWKMGWMHESLEYFSKEAIHRRFHHHQLTFGLVYAWSENFVLPISHDEVVHGKGSLVNKMPGDRWQQLANLRALFGWMWAHPGKQLLFMGCELAQLREWAHEGGLDWHLLDDPGHAGVQALIRDLNDVQRAHPALWQRDFSPDGFRWIDANDSDQSVYSFLRIADDGGPGVACVANLTPIPRHGYRIGLPAGGRWREVLNTDDVRYGGSGLVNGGDDRLVGTDDDDGGGGGAMAWHGFERSIVLTLPPLGVLWLAPATRGSARSTIEAWPSRRCGCTRTSGSGPR